LANQGPACASCAEAQVETTLVAPKAACASCAEAQCETPAWRIKVQHARRAQRLRWRRHLSLRRQHAHRAQRLSVRRQLGESRSSMRIVRRGSVVEEVLNDAPMGSVRVRRRGSRVAAEDVRAGFRSSKAGRQVACKCNAEAPMGSVEDDDDGRSRRGSFRR